MSVINLINESEGLRHNVEVVLKELMEIRSDSRALGERDSFLRQQLVDTLSMMGLEDGDSMLAPEIGLTVSLSRRTDTRLDSYKLEALGVPPTIIERATERNTSRIYATIRETQPPQIKR